MTDRNQIFDTARSPRRRIMPVDVDTARRRTVTSEVRATGRVEALNAVELKPDESGCVVALLFREGQQVDSGTPPMRIDADLLRALHTIKRAFEAMMQMSKIDIAAIEVLRSTFLPRTLGAISLLGGLGWLLYLYEPLAHRLQMVIVGTGVIGALVSVTWLLAYGVNEERWREQAEASRASVWR
ncbi:MAG: hypothetical protein ACYC7F_01085 [Gemmatimonadaceae bacterium]